MNTGQVLTKEGVRENKSWISSLVIDGLPSWSPLMRSDLLAEHPKPASHNLSFRNEKRSSMAMKDGKLFITSRRRSAAGPSMRSITVEPECLGVGNLTCDVAHVKPSVSTTSMS